MYEEDFLKRLQSELSRDFERALLLWSLIEISCTRSSTELWLVRQLLVQLVSSYRYEGPEVDMRLAKSEAKELHEAIQEKAFGKEEFIRIRQSQARNSSFSATQSST